MTDPTEVTLEQLQTTVQRGLRRAPIPFESDSPGDLTLTACLDALEIIVRLAGAEIDRRIEEREKEAAAKSAAALEVVKAADQAAAENGTAPAPSRASRAKKQAGK